MAVKQRDSKRSSTGYGSTYYKSGDGARAKHTGIGTVLGGQVWMIKPDKQAQAQTPCLWMQAGAVKFKSCNNFYDCTACKYDHALQVKVAKGNQISWQDAMRRRPALERICRHSLTGRMPQRSCPYNYMCAGCEFDQYFEDTLAPKTKTLPRDMMQVKGFDLPRDYHFHNGHTWARIESGGYLRVGLDDFSHKIFGQADAFDLPLMGKELDLNKIGWGLRRGDHQADVRSPVGGVIVEVNQRVAEDPALAHREPYGDGWLFLVRTPDVKVSAKQLMANQSCLEWMRAEVGTLETMVEAVAGPLAADGGAFGPDLFGNLPGLNWRDLTQTFLRT
jgi:glycine cleavage system H lipoate-binding protein